MNDARAWGFAHISHPCHSCPPLLTLRFSHPPTPSPLPPPLLLLPGISKAELDVDEACASLRLAQKRRLLHELNRKRPSPAPPPAPPPPPNEPGVLTVLSGIRLPDGVQSPLDHVRHHIGEGARGLLRHFAGRSKRTRLASSAEGGEGAAAAAALGYHDDEEEGGGEQADSGAEATASDEQLGSAAGADAGATAAGGRAESQEKDSRTEDDDDEEEDEEHFLDRAINFAERATGLDIDRDGDTGVRNVEEEVEHDELRMRALRRHRRRLQAAASSSWDGRL